MPPRAPVKCFRCGTDIVSYTYFGQLTISGFYDRLHPAYYNQYNLCRDCHMKLTSAIKKCLFEEDNNGNGS